MTANPSLIDSLAQGTVAGVSQAGGGMLLVLVAIVLLGGDRRSVIYGGAAGESPAING